MVKKKVKVSVIIINWNTKKLLVKCLRSLLPEQGSFEVIVVDNGSTDGSIEMIEKKFPMVVLLKNKKNLGFGAANNQAMKKAKGEYFLLLNSDTVILNNAHLKMAEFMDKHPQVGVVGCKLLNPDRTPQPSAGSFPNLLVSAIMLFFEHWLGNLVRTSYHQTKEVDWVMGAALMVRPEVIKRAGFMDEGIFMYMDEIEWCYRIKKAGYKVMFYPGSKIIHLGRGSSKAGRKDPILNIYRGLIYFYKKHCPSWQLSILKMMLKLKAAISLIVGWLTGNNYLKQTYAEAFKIA